MSRLKKKLKDYIRLLLLQIHASIIGRIVLVSISSVGGIYLLPKTFLSALIETLQIPTPQWATIALALLLVLYICLKLSKDHSSNKSIFIHDSDLKWRVTIHKNGTFKRHDTPYCKQHNAIYYHSPPPANQYICGEMAMGKSQCNSRVINESELTILKNLAKIKAEKKARKYGTKC